MTCELRITPKAGGKWEITLEGKTICTADSQDEAMIWANAFVDGWRAALSLMPRIHGPAVDWQAVRDLENQQ